MNDMYVHNDFTMIYIFLVENMIRSYTLKDISDFKLYIVGTFGKLSFLRHFFNNWKLQK